MREDISTSMPTFTDDHGSLETNYQRKETVCGRLKQRIQTIEMFTFVAAIINNNTIMFFYAMAGMISSMERVFHFDSTTMGRLLMAPELGPLGVLLICHFSNRFNMSYITGTMAIAKYVAVFLVTLPHYVLETDTSYSYEDGDNQTLLCRPDSRSLNLAESRETENHVTSNNVAFGIMFSALVIFGLTSYPVYSLPNSIVEHNTKKHQTTLYVALISIGWATSPFLGLLLSAWCMSLYVDLTETSLTPEDPAWIGAWWLALVIIAVLGFVPSLFLFLCPKDFKTRTQHLQSDTYHNGGTEVEKTKLQDCEKLKQDAKKKVYSWKGFLLSLRRLISNPVYLILVFGSVCWAQSNYGFMIFFPKLYEEMFRMTAWQASVAAGLVSGVGILVGRFTSGFIATFFKMSLHKSHIICIVMTIVGTLCLVVNIFLGCKNPALIGTPGDNGACNCIETGTAVAGECHTECHMFIPYTIVAVIMFMATAYSQPLVIVFTMRCVDREDTTLAYGLSLFFCGLLGWLPAPSLFGAMIDTTCAVWEDQGGGVRGSCWVYDQEAFGHKVHGLSAGINSLQTVCYVIVYILGRRKFEVWEKHHQDEDDN